MKKLVIVLLVAVLCLCAAWEYRIELLVWGAPRIRAIVDPVPPNVPIG